MIIDNQLITGKFLFNFIVYVSIFIFRKVEAIYNHFDFSFGK
jgi:hypothetical protein